MRGWEGSTPADPAALEAKGFREEKKERPEHLSSKDQVVYLKEMPWFTISKRRRDTGFKVPKDSVSFPFLVSAGGFPIGPDYRSNHSTKGKSKDPLKIKSLCNVL